MNNTCQFCVTDLHCFISDNFSTLKIKNNTPILDKLLEYKRNWIQHVNRMPRNRLPRVMKHYFPTGRRNYGRSSKTLLDTWDQNGSTSGPNMMMMMIQYISALKSRIKEHLHQDSPVHWLIMGFTPGRSKRHSMPLLHSIQTDSDNQPGLFPVGTSKSSCEEVATYLHVMPRIRGQGAINLVPHTFSISVDLHLIHVVSFLNRHYQCLYHAL
jgi:hypothetical protein